MSELGKLIHDIMACLISLLCFLMGVSIGMLAEVYRAQKHKEGKNG
jgi:hypothetical protein